MEQLLWELFIEDTNEHGLPPGFRFHPTDEELVTFYLASKVFNGGFGGVNIAEVDLNRCEPWELPEVAKMGEREWYFYSLRDRKYPTGLRTNRATGSGYWKATGKDREVYSSTSGALVGMKKTLVFYKGRAPRGEKTKWVLHEYRLEGDLSCRHTCKEEWVICRIFHKAMGEKKNPFFHSHTFFLEPPPPLPPSPPPPIPSLQSMQSFNYDLDPINNNNPNYEVLLRHHHCSTEREANPIPKQYPLPPPLQAELQEGAALHCNWIDPFVAFDVGIFHPSVQDVMAMPLPGSEPLIM